LSKKLHDVSGVLESVRGNRGLFELLLVRYISAFSGKEGEEHGIDKASKVFGIGKVDVRKGWGKRDTILSCSDASYLISGFDIPYRLANSSNEG
jgi:hypothetical protein